MARFAFVTAGAAVFFVPLLACGHGLVLVRPPLVTAYYYLAPVPCLPVVAVPVYPLCVPPPTFPLPSLPVAPGPTYAPPAAAPPSPGPSTPEPPLAAPAAPAKPTASPPSRSPGFGESTSFYNTYPVASPAESGRAGHQYNVDFWNLSGKDLVLQIDGKPPLVLPPNKDLPVTTGPQFTWQVEGRDKQTTRVRNGESALQIVIRR